MAQPVVPPKAAKLNQHFVYITPSFCSPKQSVAAKYQDCGLVPTGICILDLPHYTDKRPGGGPEPHQTLLPSTTKWTTIIVLSLWVIMKLQEQRHLNSASNTACIWGIAATVMKNAWSRERELQSKPPQPGKRLCHSSGPAMAVKKYLPPKSITAPLISAPQAGRKTRHALFLEVRGCPRRAKSSK